MITSYGLINDRAPYLVADLAEIICYFENREVSRGDIEQILAEKGGHGLLSELQQGSSSSAEANEKFQTLSEETFEHLRYREKAFGDWYPFDTDADILKPVEEPSRQQKIYVALLAFSRMKMFEAVDRQKFASEFERLCVEAAEGVAGSWAVIHFGAGGRDRAEFGNKFQDAILALAKRLHEIPLEKAINEISDHDVADGGIDIVLARDWNDSARAVPAYFAQCAAQKDKWPTKIFESHYLNVRKYMSFFHPPGNIMFIPLCYRNTDGNWVSEEGHESVLLDRLRLIELLEHVAEKSDQPDEYLGRLPQPFELGCAL